MCTERNESSIFEMYLRFKKWMNVQQKCNGDA